MNIERPKSKQPIPEDAKRVFQGVISDIYQWKQEMFDGTKRTFEKIKRLDSVVVFPVLPDGKIILSEQEQSGRLDSFWGTPGGRIERGEDALSAAKRELLEETGYEADEFVLWTSQQPYAQTDWVSYIFIAKGLKKVGDMDLDGGEKIKLFSVTLDELVDKVISEYKTFDIAELVPKFFEAKLDPKKMEELKELFKPLENNL